MALLLSAAALAAGASGAAGAPRAPTGTWTGALSLPRGADPVTISLQLRGGRALVALGPGHAARTEVAASVSARRVRVSLPARPAPLRLDLRVRGRLLAGTARQGPLRGTARLRRGALTEAASLGAYRLEDGRTLAAVSVVGPRLGVVYETGEIRGLYRTAPGRYAAGAGLAVRNPVAGEARLAGTSVEWRGVRGERLPLREEEVRFRSGAVTLAGTLTLPPEAGPHPAVALLHGSGTTSRATNSILTAFYASRGLAVLAYDKRGIGQSGGAYPGQRATQAAVDTYARDAQAAARFLAAQPEVDPRRVGLSGASQAGWIMPLAAVREPAIRFLVLLVGPTVTEGESDTWGALTGLGERDPGDLAAIEAEVRRQGPSGFDPLPSIRALRVPALWLYGGNDLNVPTRLSVERLDPLTREAGRDLSYVVFPHANHGLIESPHGLAVEVERSSSYAPGVFTTIEAWLAKRGLRG